jgi:hypothetical protein
MFKRDAAGNLRLPKGKERVYRGVASGGADKINPLDVFNPEPRIETYEKRKNGILRTIEFLCGLSYGIISDNNVVDKTAEEFKSSKNRLITTVSGVQLDTMQQAIDHLIVSYNVLADLQGIPQGNCEAEYEWSEAYALDRQAEVDERVRLTGGGLMFIDEFRSWYNEIPIEEAQQELDDRGVPYKFVGDEFNATS